jgi:hypothetical protein
MRRLHFHTVTNFIDVTYHVVTCPHVVTTFLVTHCIAKVTMVSPFERFLMEGLWKEAVRTPQFR